MIGSFLRIIQSCSQCGKGYVWESQPFIGKIPAGNILTSAAILYAGALPTKSLRMFKILNLATITRKTFCHQSMNLQPTSHLVWKRHQGKIIQQLRKDGKALVLAGDGMAESHGHSAKYGSYSVLDLAHNKIVDFKLVQVC